MGSTCASLVSFESEWQKSLLCLAMLMVFHDLLCLAMLMAFDDLLCLAVLMVFDDLLCFCGSCVNFFQPIKYLSIPSNLGNNWAIFCCH